MTKLHRSLSTLLLAALGIVLSSCGPFSSGPDHPATATVVAGHTAVAAAIATATQGVQARLSDTAAAIANATGISQDQTVVAEQNQKLGGYGTATAVVIATATRREAATAVAVRATAQSLTKARTQQTAQAENRPGLTYAEALLNVIQADCLPATANLSDGFNGVSSVLKTRGIFGDFSAAKSLITSGGNQLAVCKRRGDGVNPPPSLKKAQRLFDQAITAYANAATQAQTGIREQYEVLLTRGAATLTRAGRLFDQLFSLLRSGGG
jgi:hypothetical protein